MLGDFYSVEYVDLWAEALVAFPALNVFGFNTTARGLYESLGYETTAVQMRKELRVPE